MSCRFWGAGGCDSSGVASVDDGSVDVELNRAEDDEVS